SVLEIGLMLQEETEKNPKTSYSI
nr:RecName: Full=Basic phospholipase A2 homolog Vur-S49 analog; Short=svPLA2 homolog [Vipera renardi]